MLPRGPGMTRASLALAGCSLALALLSATAAARHAASRQFAAPCANPQLQLTFNRDIAPILYRSCASCHRPGEAGPFPLLTYTDAKLHARQIVAVTQKRIMPPWLPELGGGEVADEPRLSEEQLVRMRAWVDQGAPEGDPADLPSPPQFV